jgi:hypothetical protein
MYSTVSIKNEWRTVFCCGNKDNPEDVILILGSCRVVPFLNYLDHANAVCGNRFKIYAIDPINYQVDSTGNHLDMAGLLKALETDEHFLSILRETTIFIHEHLQSFGILNTSKDAETNIYQFGMSPRIDVAIPNFHDCLLLFRDLKNLGVWTGSLTDEEQANIKATGDQHIDRFCGICEKSSFPEFAQFFRDNYLKTRLFHSFNHVSSAFTLEIFRLMNEKFLHLPLDGFFWNKIGQEDIYANVQTPLCTYDVKWRPYEWPELVVEP